VHLRSATGEADVAISVRKGLERGVLLLPFAHRDRLAVVTDGAGEVEVEARRA
jgi:hypothetical protein